MRGLCREGATRGDRKRRAIRRRGSSHLLHDISETESFDLDEFQTVALREPDRIERFQAFKTEYEEEAGQELTPSFKVSKKEATKAKKRLKGVVKLNTGVVLKFSTSFIDQAHTLLDRGYDNKKKMNYMKVYYHNEEDAF